jgi:SAM-dependent methyltransferase
MRLDWTVSAIAGDLAGSGRSRCWILTRKSRRTGMPTLRNNAGVPPDPLPMGLTFDAVAADYAKYRPGYPDALFDDLGSLVSLCDATQVLEVGCGTGQATRPLLEAGCHVLAVEPGPAMVAIARTNHSRGRFDVELATFDDWEPVGRRFDLVLSATAYHWVAPAIRWTKGAAVLRPGGSLALLTNRTVSGGSFDQLHRLSFGLHQQHGVAAQEAGSPSEADLVKDLQLAYSDIGALWAVAEPKGGMSEAGPLFAEPTIRWYPWESRYGTSDAVGLLSTYSPYLAIPRDRRQALLSALETLINDHFGGQVTRRYLAILAVAPRR